MKMTAIQFEFLAKILRDAMPEGAISDLEVGEAIGVATVILGFADALQDTNDNFDRARFIRACSRCTLANIQITGVDRCRSDRFEPVDVVDPYTGFAVHVTDHGTKIID